MWTIEEITKATGGKADGSIGKITSVSIDSRKMEPDSLFVALKGERADGHDFIKNAFANGAKAALVSKIPDNVSSANLILVKDTYKALVDMAKYSRARAQGKIIAVTGSVGKTGAKEAIRIALSDCGSVFATQGNFNNHIGLPLTLANFDANTQFGVFELGMNHTGEISFLTNLLKPDVAVITTVEAAHLEFFKDVSAIADAKAEIMEGLNKQGTIILNRDNNFYEKLADKAREHGIKKIITFGENFEADFRLAHYTLENFGSQVQAVINKTPITYRLGTVGRHWALTSLAALAAATTAGAFLPDAAAALASFHEPEGRGRIHILQNKKEKVIIIDDSYNASPASTKAAIEKLADLQKSLGSGRKIAILGDMLELGTNSEQLHKDLLLTLQINKIDVLHASGTMMKHLFEAAPISMQGSYATDSTRLATLIKDTLKNDDIVLIKGSHGSRMDIVRDAILNRKELADAI